MMTHTWFIVGVVLVVSVYVTEGAPKAEPAPVANPEPCCGRGGAFVRGAVVGAAVSRIRHGGGGGCGCHGCCGRKKRGIPDIFNKDKVEHYHKKMLADDKNQCGLRLICELAQKDEARITGKEKLVMLPYRGSGASDGSSFGLYDEAAWHGSEGRNCHLLYPLCSFAADHIMEHAEDLPKGQYEFI
ncbi:unnamed protein product [Meganyctiphanes norvegica]|uniref:Uncharacterized protein n=1 Tax=Meganyctiphanes norvegica TaxID=48144 RepID=A0AAV2R0G0_MEGNR